MTHNGKLVQCNIQKEGYAKNFITRNIILTGSSGGWTSSNTKVSPLLMNRNGYPKYSLSAAWSRKVYIPPASWYAGSSDYNPLVPRTGRYILGWEGDAISVNNITISGVPFSVYQQASSAVDGYKVLTINAGSDPAPYLNVIINQHNASDPITKLYLVREDHWAGYQAGEVWNPEWIELLGNYGVIRNYKLGHGIPNASELFSARKGYDNINWSGGASGIDETLYYGDMSGPDGTFVLGTGTGTLTDKMVVYGTAHISSSLTAPTMNFRNTGAKTIRAGGTAGTISYGSQRFVAGKVFALTYNALLDVWLLSPDLSDNIGGWPLEPFLDLCIAVGAHAHCTCPDGLANPLHDHVRSHISFAKSKLEPNGLKLIYEGPNECWNTDYASTQYAEKEEIVYGYSSSGGAYYERVGNWYGRVMSQLGQAMSEIYGGDRTKYDCMVGVKSSDIGTTANARPSAIAYTANRMYSSRTTGPGQDAAINWVTGIMPASYHDLSFTLAQLQVYATEWKTADATRKAAIYEELVAGADTEEWIARLRNWRGWADSFGVPLKMMAYEGGWGPDYNQGDTGSDVEYMLNALKWTSSIYDEAMLMFTEFYAMGGVYPSHFWLGSNDLNFWTATAYNTFENDRDHPQLRAAIDFSNTKAIVDFTFSVTDGTPDTEGVFRTFALTVAPAN